MHGPHTMALIAKPWLTTACCAALTAGIWALAWLAPARHAAWLQGWPGWATLAFAALAWLQGIAADPDQAPGRRLQVSMALLLLASLLFSPVLATMPHLDGLPQPDALVQAVGKTATLWWLSPIASASLLLLWRHPRLPVALSWPCGLGAACCLMPLPLLLAPWLSSMLTGKDIALWALFAALMVLYARGSGRHVGLLMLLVPVAVLLHNGLQVFGPLATRPGHWMLAGLALGIPVWAAWWWRMDEVARFDRARAELAAQPAPPPTPPQDTPEPHFDLQSYLDSPKAREGADKYTRE